MAFLTTHYSYLVILVVSLLGLLLADWRGRFVVFASARAAVQTWAVLIAFFLTWDIGGILLNIFATNQRFVVGLHIVSPNLPIEEGLFLSLLIYVTLMFYTFIVRRDPHA